MAPSAKSSFLNSVCTWLPSTEGFRGGGVPFVPYLVSILTLKVQGFKGVFSPTLMVMARALRRVWARHQHKCAQMTQNPRAVTALVKC